MDDAKEMSLSSRLEICLPRMRQLLNHDVEFDLAAMHELMRISGSVRESAVSAGGTDLAQIADQLLWTVNRMAMPSRHISIGERLALWHLFIKLKTAARQIH
jgi:hypothetical protein